MLLRLLPLITGLAPIVAVHGSYLIAIRAGILPVCMPYIAGCTSISATGRYPPASFLFKSVMMPEAILMAAYWLFSVAWLRSLERAAGRAANGGTMVGVFGVAGAFFLIVYVTFLGTEGTPYPQRHRNHEDSAHRGVNSVRAWSTQPGPESGARRRHYPGKNHRMDICAADAQLFPAELFLMAGDGICRIVLGRKVPRYVIK
jgi:hypothetical protein